MGKALQYPRGNGPNREQASNPVDDSAIAVALIRRLAGPPVKRNAKCRQN